MHIRERLDFLQKQLNISKHKIKYNNECLAKFKNKLKSKLNDDAFSLVQQYIQSIPSKYNLIYLFIYHNYTFIIFWYFNESNCTYLN